MTATVLAISPRSFDSAALELLLRLLIWCIGLLLLLSLVLVAYSVILRVRNNRESVRERRNSDRWPPLILSYITGDIGSEEIHRTVTGNEAVDFADFLFRFAGRLKGEEAEAVHRLAKPYLPVILEFSRTRNAAKRARYIRMLGILGLPEYEQRVIEALDDPSLLVSMVAVRVLARQGNEVYVRPILDRFERFHDWDDAFLASILAGVGTGAIPFLLEIYRDRRRAERTRQVTAVALNLLNASVAGDAAAEALLTTRYLDLRTTSLRLLRNVGGGEHAESVRKLFPIENEIVLAQALGTLGRIGSEKDLAILQPALDHPSAWVAIHAARGIRDLGGKEFLRGVAESDHPRGELARQVLAEDRS